MVDKRQHARQLIPEPDQRRELVPTGEAQSARATRHFGYKYARNSEPAAAVLGPRPLGDQP